MTRLSEQGKELARSPVVVDTIPGLEPMELDPSAWKSILPPEKDIASASITVLPCAQGKYTTDDHDPRNREALATEFTRIGKDCRDDLEQLGLHRKFSGVLGRMLKETRMVFVQPEDESISDISSEFYIVKRGEPKAERLLFLNPDEIKTGASELNQAMDSLQFTPARRDVLHMTTLEVVIGRKIMDLTNTACYMQQQYGGFRPGFGGYTPSYLTRRTIALDYLSRNTLDPDLFNNSDIETQRIIHGFGSRLLATSLQRFEVVDSEQKASWVVRAVLMQARAKLVRSDVISDKMIGAAAALSTDELGARVHGIFPKAKPEFSHQTMKALSDAVELENEEG